MADAAAAEIEAAEPGDAATAGDAGPRRRGRARPASKLRSDQSSTHPDEPATDTGGGLVRLRLAISYDGTALHGWARQPGQRTVQGELEQALADGAAAAAST